MALSGMRVKTASAACSRQQQTMGMAVSAGYRKPLLPAYVKQLKPTARQQICKPVCFKEDDDRTAAKHHITNNIPGVVSSSPLTSPHFTTQDGTIDVGPIPHMLYGGLSIIMGLASLVATFMPEAVARTVFSVPAASTANLMMVRAVGMALLPSVLANLSLMRSTRSPGQGYMATDVGGTAAYMSPATAAAAAAASGIPPSPLMTERVAVMPLVTFKQLNFSELLFSLLGLVVLAQAVSLRNPVISAVMGGLLALEALTTTYALMKVRVSGSPIPSVRGVIGATAGVFAPTGLRSLGYSLLAVGLAWWGMSLLGTSPTAALPTTPLFTGRSALEVVGETFLGGGAGVPLHVFLSRLLGALMLRACVHMVTLKEAVDSRMPESRAFRGINLGNAAGAGLIAAMLAMASKVGDVSMAPLASRIILAGFLFKAAVCAWNFFAASTRSSVAPAAMQ